MLIAVKLKVNKCDRIVTAGRVLRW